MATVTFRKRFLWLLKNTLNRFTSRLARAGWGPFSLIRHVGRKTGRVYETPVILARVPEGFIAELTYGDNVDWYRNVLAAGECVVVHQRREYHIKSIDRCSVEAGRRAYPPPLRQFLAAAHRREFRLLQADASQRTT
jgi:deazaflavin-dependent oxidoreductase (nitroreductase family)